MDKKLNTLSSQYWFVLTSCTLKVTYVSVSKIKFTNIMTVVLVLMFLLCFSTKIELVLL